MPNSKVWIYEEFGLFKFQIKQVFTHSFSNPKNLNAQSTIWAHIKSNLDLGILVSPLTVISTTFEKFLKGIRIKVKLTSFLEVQIQG